MAILAAYIQRGRTGEGQELEVSMQEAVTYFTRTRTYMHGAWGKEATPRNGNAGGLPPVNIYPCKPFGANDYIYLMPVNQGHWDGLCAAMDRPDLLVDERFADVTNRVEHADALYAEISAWTGARTKQEAMEAIAAVGVPCSAILDTAELHHDRHLQAREFVHEVDLPLHGKVPMLGFPPQFSDSSVPISAPPRLGEHTEDVLRADLGLDETQLRAMRDAGVTVGLGVDGSASNDQANLADEARQAMLLQRVAYGADKMSAREALEIATVGGAKALGRADVGRIKPGLRADLAVWDISGVESAGNWDPAAFLLAGPRRVKHLFVEGRQIVDDGRLTTIDLRRTVGQARLAVEALSS